MVLSMRHSPTIVDTYTLNTSHLHEGNAKINTRNYLSFRSSPSPMSFRDLRLVVTNRIPSNIVILPSRISSSQTSKSSRQKTKHRKDPKPPTVDVYRSLVQSASQCSLTDRSITNDERPALTNSFTVGRISPSYSASLIHPHSLPKLSKPSNQKSNKNTPSMSSLKPEYKRLTSPSKQYSSENNDKMSTTSKVSSDKPKLRNRKQLHVYMPQMTC